eukprot:g4263.t1
MLFERVCELLANTPMVRKASHKEREERDEAKGATRVSHWCELISFHPPGPRREPDVILPDGDLERGSRLFKLKCGQCHTIHSEGMNKQGPCLWRVLGRRAGQVQDFEYTDANRTSEITWSEKHLFKYIENPRKYIPGTRMAFLGIRIDSLRVPVCRQVWVGWVCSLSYGGGAGPPGTSVLCNLFKYIENPRKYIPGTRMAFLGIKDEQERADVVAFVKAKCAEEAAPSLHQTCGPFDFVYLVPPLAADQRRLKERAGYRFFSGCCAVIPARDHSPAEGAAAGQEKGRRRVREMKKMNKLVHDALVLGKVVDHQGGGGGGTASAGHHHPPHLTYVQRFVFVLLHPMSCVVYFFQSSNEFLTGSQMAESVESVVKAWRMLAMSFLLCMTLWSYVQTVLTKPGAPPAIEETRSGLLVRKDVGTELYCEKRKDEESGCLRVDGAVVATAKAKGARYCKHCSNWKPDRTHHCRWCGACCLRMDHHCPWVNNCVGYRNTKYFVLMLFYATLFALFYCSVGLARDRTTIELLDETKAVRLRQPLVSILGRNVRSWWLPVEPDLPGDGMTWHFKHDESVTSD